MKENHVLKSFAELSRELLGTKAAAPEKKEQPQPEALMEETEPQSIRPGFPAASEIRRYRGWGINE